MSTARQRVVRLRPPAAAPFEPAPPDGAADRAAGRHSRESGDPAEDPADRAFCAELLPLVSRTFALSITTLPESLRDTIRVAYLLCRVVDTVEDDAALEPLTRVRLFDAFDGLMADDGADERRFEELCRQGEVGRGHDRRLCLGAGAVFRQFRSLPVEHRAAVRPHVLEMSRGMREHCARADAAGKLRLRDMAELERYCYFVAGTVGKLLTALFELEVPGLSGATLVQIRARAVSFGLALQLVNIVKDVAEDLERGDCFLPESYARDAGIPLDAVLDAARREQGLAVVARVCDRAREHLRRAREYTHLWPVDRGREVRLFCTVPLALALATLREVERGADTLLAGRTPKVSRDVVWQVLRDARVAIERDDTLSWMLSHYASGGYELDAGPKPSAEQAQALERAQKSAPPRRSVAPPDGAKPHLVRSR